MFSFSADDVAICRRRVTLLYFAPFEPFGHHTLYAREMLHGAEAQEASVIIAGSDGLLAEVGNSTCNSVRMECLGHGVIRRAGNPSLALRAAMQLLDGERVARATGADLVFHSWIDQALLAIALGIARLPISGIWFRVPALPLSNWSPARRLLYRRAFASKALRHVYVLDEEVANALNSEPWTRRKVRYLPEPLDLRPGILPSELIEPVAKARTEGRRIYGIVGVLDERKGIENVLQAISSLPLESSRKITLLLAGSFTGQALERRCFAKIRRLEGQARCFSLIVLNRKLSDEEFAGVIEECDTILLTYTGNYRGSSGVLVQAGARGKSIIGCNRGIVARLIEKFALGSTVNPDDPASILAAIRHDLSAPWEVSDQAIVRFRQNFRNDSFSETILVDM